VIQGEWRLDRRKFLKRLAVGVLGVGALSTIDGFLVEPRIQVIERVTVRLRRLPEAFHQFRLVVMGDFHFGPWIGESQIEHAVRLALSLRPDLTVFTGDFVSHPLFKPDGPAGAKHADPCGKILRQLTGSQVVGVLGNHDHWNGADAVEEILKTHQIPILRNRSIPIERNGQRIWLVGVDDVFEEANDLGKALEGVPSEEMRIVAVHEPDFAEVVTRHGVDLQLSGHSHGGQVWIPGYGAPILPELAQKYPRGLYQVGNLQAYTNRGIGMVAPPVRLNCPPEVTLITLVAGT